MTVPATTVKNQELIDVLQGMEDAINLKPQIVRVPLAAVDTAGGLFAWQNPEDTAVIISRVWLNVTTASSGACTADVGTTATSATTLSDNLIDGASLAAIALLSNNDDAGTNGKQDQLLASGKWVTGSISSGASAGIVGFAYIEYVTLDARATGALDLSV